MTFRLISKSTRRARKAITAILAASAFGVATSSTDAAAAACLDKAAEATAGSESSAKWFAMETMVQAVS